MTSFGETLRRERELRGVSLREIADETKISLRFLQALEDDRLDVLPGGVFRRAFVRQYASHLGLDADRLVAELQHEHAERAPEQTRHTVEATHPGSVLLVGVLVVVAVLSVLKAGQLGDPAAEKASRPVPAALPPVERPAAVPSAAPATQSVEVDGLVLTLSARQDCWVEARVDGQVVLNRVLVQGQSQTLAASGEIVLSVGNAGGLALSVNDQPGVPLGRSGEVRRNIVITRKSLPALIEETSPARHQASSS